MSTLINCAQCGTLMPLPSGRRARKRYCSEPCRKAAWRERHRDDAPHRRDIVSNVVPDIVSVPMASRDDVATPGGQHRCPHCRQPLAIISVIVPAGAATIAVPEAPMTTR